MGKGDRCVRLKTLSISCVACLEIFDSQPAGTLSACNKSGRGLLSLYLSHLLPDFPEDRQIVGYRKV